MYLPRPCFLSQQTSWGLRVGSQLPILDSSPVFSEPWTARPPPSHDGQHRHGVLLRLPPLPDMSSNTERSSWSPLTGPGTRRGHFRVAGQAQSKAKPQLRSVWGIKSDLGKRRLPWWVCLWKKGLRFPLRVEERWELPGYTKTQWVSLEPGDHRLKMDICVFFFFQRKRLFSSSHGKTEWTHLTACFLDQSALSPCYQFSVIKRISWTYYIKLLPFILKQLLGPLSLFPHQLHQN